MPTSLEILLSEALIKEPGSYSIAVKNLDSGQYWAINSGPMRAASLIKIFIMVEAFNQSGRGHLDLTEKQVVTNAVKVGGAGSLEHAPDGTVKTWLELIELMIVESDNTATNMLIDRLTMANINTMIERLGCQDTVLQRKMMDFASAAQGRENFTSVTDVASVLEQLYFCRCLDTARDEAMLAILKRQEDKCKIPYLLPKDVTVAHKTGELDGAEHDAGIVYGPRYSYIIAVMADSLPDALRTQETIAGLSRMVYDFLNIME